jgi:hypothetical protein
VSSLTFRVCASSALVSFLVACGGTTSAPVVTPDGGGSDAATSDGGSSDSGSTDPDAAGGCVHQPAADTACVPGQLSCDRVDLCCASAAACDPTTQKWKLTGNACLLCSKHGCGDKTCAGNEMCVSQAPGTPGGQPTYSCAAYPAACAREWTCGCVTKNLPTGCALAGNGCNDTDFPVKLSCMGI